MQHAGHGREAPAESPRGKLATSCRRRLRFTGGNDGFFGISGFAVFHLRQPAGDEGS
jgi:hypothetical protein